MLGQTEKKAIILFKDDVNVRIECRNITNAKENYAACCSWIRWNMKKNNMDVMKVKLSIAVYAIMTSTILFFCSILSTTTHRFSMLLSSGKM